MIFLNRIFLTASYAGDEDDVNFCRTFFKSLGFEVEEYSKNRSQVENYRILVESQFQIIIPPNGTDFDDGYIAVGKGLYSQAKQRDDFAANNNAHYNTFILSGKTSANGMHLPLFAKMQYPGEIIDENDWSGEYGEIDLVTNDQAYLKYGSSYFAAFRLEFIEDKKSFPYPWRKNAKTIMDQRGLVLAHAVEYIKWRKSFESKTVPNARPEAPAASGGMRLVASPLARARFLKLI